MSAANAYIVYDTLSDRFAHSVEVVRKVSDLHGRVSFEGKPKWFYAGTELNDNDRSRLEQYCRRNIAICQDAADEIVEEHGSRELTSRQYGIAVQYIVNHIAIAWMDSTEQARDWWNTQGPRFRQKARLSVRIARAAASRAASSFSRPK